LDPARNSGVVAAGKWFTNTYANSYGNTNTDTNSNAASRRWKLCRAVERDPGLHRRNDSERGREQLYRCFLDAKPEPNYSRQ
jgi:hypothetical protein